MIILRLDWITLPLGVDGDGVLEGSSDSRVQLLCWITRWKQAGRHHLPRNLRWRLCLFRPEARSDEFSVRVRTGITLSGPLRLPPDACYSFDKSGCEKSVE